MRTTYVRVNVAALVLLAAAAALPRLLTLSSDRQGVRAFGWTLPELCLVRRTIGQPCASCGLGRSLVMLAHGDWHAALEKHPGGPVLYLWLLGQILTRGAIVLAGSRGRLFWLDVALSAVSLAFACGAVLTLSLWRHGP